MFSLLRLCMSRFASFRYMSLDMLKEHGGLLQSPLGLPDQVANGFHRAFKERVDAKAMTCMQRKRNVPP